MTVKNPYEVLGLAPNATPDEVRAGYWLLIQKLYNENPDARNLEHRQRRNELNLAFGMLSEPQRRAAWDAGDVGAALKPGPLNELAQMLNDATDAFNDAVGGIAGRKAVKKVIADAAREGRGRQGVLKSLFNFTARHEAASTLRRAARKAGVYAMGLRLVAVRLEMLAERGGVIQADEHLRLRMQIANERFGFEHVAAVADDSLDVLRGKKDRPALRL